MMRVGHGRTALAPRFGEPMGGYVDRQGGVAGIHDLLEVHAVTFADGERRFALVTVDLICVNADLAGSVRRMLARQGIDACWLTATHTHAGPEAGCRPGGTVTPEDLAGRVRDAVATAVGDAVRSEQFAQLTLGRVEVPGIAGRRSLAAAGDGERMPIDVVAVRCAGELRGVVAVSPIHPTVLGAANRQCSADLNGGIRSALGRMMADGSRAPWAVVATGAAGDISTRHTRRAASWDEVDRLGALAAEAVVAELNQEQEPEAVASDGNGIIGPLKADVTLAAKTRANWALPELYGPSRISDGSSTSDTNDRSAETFGQGLRIAAELLDSGCGAPHDVSLEGVCLGGITLLAIPGEPFLALGEAVRAGAPEPDRCVVIGYANGYLGYIPDEASYAAPAYEVLASPLAIGGGEAVVAAASDLVARLAGLAGLARLARLARLASETSSAE
ncbi:hypothetical protein GCM10009839_45310 [Catenulispora yoronensis]|uniref:Neutral/alkaline non-lysosomal ceramidase N-terminal domain-containing protein n=1 Tax=Catenulispora yoronensis TaxID=450799 RepID=A0ABP5G423_9ACTN